MDKILRIVISIFIVLFAVFASWGLYGAYVAHQYRQSLTSTYEYSLTFSTSETLRNVTLFIPVPEDMKGKSPFIEQYSAGTFTGIPAGWAVTLLGSDKATMLKLEAAVISGSDMNGFSFTNSATESVKGPIDTKSPVSGAIILRPVQKPRSVACPELNAPESAGAVCSLYESAVYADYEASPNAKIEIDSTLVGKNTWTIFQPAANEYRNSISVTMLGANHGWVIAKGTLLSGIGSYDVPEI